MYWMKKHKVYAGLFVIAILLFPIIIHSLFKTTAPCDWLIAVWTAGDLLGYFGAIFGAAATIIAIVCTIRFTIENQKTERKLSIKPHLQTTYHPIFDRSKAAAETANKAIFITYPHDETEVISSSYEPPYALTKEKKKEPSSAIIDTLFFLKQYYIIHYTLKNVGAGNAINVSFKIDGKPLIPPFSIAVNEHKVFIILLGAELLHDTERSILFEFSYQDVASISRYEQHERIVLYTENDKSLKLNIRQAVDDLITMPKEL